MKKILIFSLITVLMASCIRPLGYFTTQPYAKPFDNKVNRTLYVVLNQDVKDSLGVMYGERVILKVSQFKKSLESSFINTFSKNFSEVKFLDKKVDTGLCLVLFRVKPFWSVGSTSTYYNASTHTNQTANYIVANFQFESSLYYKGEKLNADDAECSSEISTASTRHFHAIFENGTRVMCEHINATLFTDPILRKIK